LIEPRPLLGGATAILEPIAGTRTLSIGFWFDFGSRHELPEERGYTHFIEHMLFKGTKRRDAAQIARTVDRLGGYLNAFTERESVCFFCTLPGDCASTAIDVLIDMIFSSTMPLGEFAKEKTVIVNEILSSEDDPDDISYDKFLKAIWPDNALSHKIAGEAAEVLAIDREKLFSFYRESFSLDRLLVCVSGAFEPEPLLESLKRGLESVPEAMRRKDRPPLVKLESPRYRQLSGYEKADIKQVQLYCGHPFALKGTVKDYYAFTVFNCAFGESMSSRLFQNIREAKGYCYSIFSFFAFANDIGLWCVNGSTTKALFADFRKSVIDEINDACRQGLTGSEAADAILHLRGSQVVAAEDIEHRMKRIARQYYYNAVVLDVDESLEEMGKITLDDVNEIAQDRIRVDQLSLYAYGAVKTGRSVSGMKRVRN
jgi:predicted Zn-dependent peptidase